MNKPDVAFDAELFSRTSSLFAAKRRVFAPGAVEMFAADIVHLLAKSGTLTPRDGAVISMDQVDAFCAVLVQADPGAAIRFIRDRRAEGVSLEDVYLGYIAAAARCLGEQWDDDRLSFLEVTCGTGHLYALMRALRLEGRPTRSRFDARKCALFATVPGEEHGIGITIAADMFRDAGWEIDLRTGCEHDELLSHIENDPPDIIGLSLSTKERLDALVRLVVAARIVVPGAIVGVAHGSDVTDAYLRSIADVDMIFDDVHSARLELEQLVANA